MNVYPYINLSPSVSVCFSHLHQEGHEAEGQVGVGVMQVLHHTLGPLEALFAEVTTAVQSHHSSQVL